jgi:hypothetical protein
VKFARQEGKELVMSNVKNLKQADAIYKAVSIAHDLTPLQREKVKEAIRTEKGKVVSDCPSVEGQGNFRIRVVGPPGRLRVFRKTLHQRAASEII